MKFRPFKLLLWCLLVLLALAAAALALTPNLQITSWSMVLNAITGAAGPQASAGSIGQHLVARAGYTLELYSATVPKARFLRPTAGGDLLVSQPRLGQILLLQRDADNNGQPDAQRVLIDGLDRPQGMDIHDGWLYIGESGRIGRIAFDAATGTTSGSYATVLGGLPEGGNHWSRTVRIGPDGWLYVTIGSSCNVCIEEHPWRAAMLRMRLDGSEVQIHASGLRNSVGFDWAPWDGELYATDNGRDLLGDDFPPCELNRVVAGGFYGWPYVNGNAQLDPDLGAGREPLLQSAISPAHGFRAHTAPLGIIFLRHGTADQRSALVALHGSWNRSVPDGYKVVQLDWDAAGKISESDFLVGFERDGKVIGRPVDVAEASDGSLFVSDDYAGAIYRLRRSEDVATRLALATDTQRSLAANPLAGISAAEITAAHSSARKLMDRYACAGCHAPGSPAGEKLSTLAERFDVDQLGAYFLFPTTPMPVFPLSEEQRRALAIHLLASAEDYAPRPSAAP